LKRILIVEDEFLIASTLQDTVLDLGHECLGPAGTLAAALILAETSQFDAALVNYVLGTETADPLCELLDRRGIPFAFATGLDGAGAGTRWADKPRLNKPYPLEDVRSMIVLLTSN
jgi:DNA-binding response OmpR family regulator